MSNYLDDPSSFQSFDTGAVTLPAGGALTSIGRFNLSQRCGLVRVQLKVGAGSTLDALQVKSGAFSPDENASAITQVDLGGTAGQSIGDYNSGTRMCPACPGLTALPGQAAGSTFALLLDTTFFAGFFEIFGGSTTGTTLQAQILVPAIANRGGQ